VGANHAPAALLLGMSRYPFYRGADKSLARPTSRCILFDGETISFDASLVIYRNSINIPPILIINRIYENQNLLSLKLVSFLVGLRTYQHPCMGGAGWAPGPFWTVPENIALHRVSIPGPSSP
jgi:hypothetical protein